LACAALWAIPATAQGPGGSVRVSATGARPELVKTIPIAKHRDEEPQVVMSLGADKIGELQDGDRLEGTADVEVSVCLKPNPRHPGANNKCVGGTYGYNPTVRALACPGTELVVERRRQHGQGFGCEVASLPPAAAAPQPNAGHRLVIGADAGGAGRVVGDKGMVNAARFPPGTLKRTRSRAIARGCGCRSRPVSAGTTRRRCSKKVLYTARIRNPREGEQVIVDGAVFARINHLRYSTFMTTTLVWARTPAPRATAPRSTPPARRAGSHGATAPTALSGRAATRPHASPGRWAGSSSSRTSTERFT
jgi:hypothetical protein